MRHGRESGRLVRTAEGKFFEVHEPLSEHERWAWVQHEALEPLQLLYLVTNEYDGTDELGFAWDDPAVGIRWPTVGGRVPILSDRDQRNPSLRDLVSQIGGPDPTPSR